MELVRIMSALRPAENVSPDLSSYETMVATWRGSGSPPTLQEVNAKGAEIQAADDAIQYLKDRKAEYAKQGLTIEAMVFAMWEKFQESDPKNADDLQVEKAAIDAQFPKPQ